MIILILTQLFLILLFFSGTIMSPPPIDTEANQSSIKWSRVFVTWWITAYQILHQKSPFKYSKTTLQFHTVNITVNCLLFHQFTDIFILRIIQETHGFIFASDFSARSQQTDQSQASMPSYRIGTSWHLLFTCWMIQITPGFPNCFLGIEISCNFRCSGDCQLSQSWSLFKLQFIWR